MNRRQNAAPHSTSALPLTAFLLVAAGATAWGLQDPEEPEHFPPMEEILNGRGSAAEETEARIRRLFGEVETTLKEVDVLLTDAAAGDTTALVDVREAGIATLLQNSLERGRQAQKDIRTIIELAQQLDQRPPSPMPGNDPGQGESQESTDSNSPLNRGQQSQSPEATPERPGEEQGPQQQEQEGDSTPESEQPGDSEPENPRGDPDQEGRNRRANEGSMDPTGSRSSADGDDGWGDLPAHVRDTFRSEGRTELPSRYRDWIDQYYTKLNKRSQLP